MIRIHNVAALLALSSVAVLPACSMFGGSSNSSPESRTSYSSPQSPALSQNMIRQVQSRLQQAGTYSGRIDGLWGPATEAAVLGYQKQHNLNATGQLDNNTLASLNLGSTNQTYGSAQPNTPSSGSIAATPDNTNTLSSNATQPIGSAQPNTPASGSTAATAANTTTPSGNAAQPIGSATR